MYNFYILFIVKSVIYDPKLGGFRNKPDLRGQLRPYQVQTYSLSQPKFNKILVSEFPQNLTTEFPKMTLNPSPGANCGHLWQYGGPFDYFRFYSRPIPYSKFSDIFGRSRAENFPN